MYSIRASIGGPSEGPGEACLLPTKNWKVIEILLDTQGFRELSAEWPPVTLCPRENFHKWKFHFLWPPPILHDFKFFSNY